MELYGEKGRSEVKNESFLSLRDLMNSLKSLIMVIGRFRERKETDTWCGWRFGWPKRIAWPSRRPRAPKSGQKRPSGLQNQTLRTLHSEKLSQTLSKRHEKMEKYNAKENPFSIASLIKNESPKRDQNDSGYSAHSDSGSEDGIEIVSRSGIWHFFFKCHFG